MAIDNSSYDAIEDIYVKIKTYLEQVKLGPEHSPLIIKHEELGALLESFDVEALEEQTKDIHGLHAQLDVITATANLISETLNSPSDPAAPQKIADDLDIIFAKINQIVL